MKRSLICAGLSLVYSVIYFCFCSRSLYEGGVIIQTYYMLGIPLGMGIIQLVTKNRVGNSKKDFWIGVVIMVAIFIGVRFGVPSLLHAISNEDSIMSLYYAAGYPNLLNLPQYLSGK